MSRGGWSEYIRGEWWIDISGQSIFADQDIGEAGHEALAIDAMLDKDILIDGLLEHAEELGLSEKTLKELEWYRNDDVGASGVYFNCGLIPDEVGIAAAGSEERWKDLLRDVRLAYAKHEGAILVINTSFYAWEVTAKTIQAIQSFIYDQAEGEDVNDPGEELLIEEAKTGRHESMTINKFLLIKTPHQIWGGMAKWQENPVWSHNMWLIRLEVGDDSVDFLLDDEKEVEKALEFLAEEEITEFEFVDLHRAKPVRFEQFKRQVRSYY